MRRGRLGGTRLRVTLLASLASFCALVPCAADSVAPERPLPNIVLISIDTLRADHTSLHGYARQTTPGLATFSSGGAAFEAAYSPTSSTAPTHASLFTGAYPSTHGLRKNGRPLDDSALTLAERLATRGYQTVGVVSSFVLDGQFGFAQGFETWLDEFDPALASVSVDEWMGVAVARGFDSRADATTGRALRWLWLARDADRPFFLFVHYFDPHAPYEPPPAFQAGFEVGLAPDVAGRFDPLARTQLDRYDREIAFTDREVARLLRGIEGLALPRGVLVVVTADHGEGLMDHGIWNHGLTVYEEAVRVPLVFRWDGEIRPGQRIVEPVELVDVAPTLLDLLGIEPGDPGFEGRSLAAALRDGATLPSDEPVFLYRSDFERGIREGLEVAGELFAVRQGRWKLIEHTAHPDFELYDLVNDPGETKNLYGARPVDASRLSKLLAAWRSQSSSAGESPAISDPTRRALQALGYTE